MTARKVEIFECPYCSEPHRDIVDAMKCCNPVPLSAWECSECSMMFYSKEAAAECHAAPAVCTCSHPKEWHARTATYAGCYEFGCRCPAYVQAVVAVLA